MGGQSYSRGQLIRARAAQTIAQRAARRIDCSAGPDGMPRISAVGGPCAGGAESADAAAVCIDKASGERPPTDGSPWHAHRTTAGAARRARINARVSEIYAEDAIDDLLSRI